MFNYKDTRANLKAWRPTDVNKDLSWTINIFIEDTREKVLVGVPKDLLFRHVPTIKNFYFEDDDEILLPVGSVDAERFGAMVEAIIECGKKGQPYNPDIYDQFVYQLMHIHRVFDFLDLRVHRAALMGMMMQRFEKPISPTDAAQIWTTFGDQHSEDSKCRMAPLYVQLLIWHLLNMKFGKGILDAAIERWVAGTHELSRLAEDRYKKFGLGSPIDPTCDIPAENQAQTTAQATAQAKIQTGAPGDRRLEKVAVAGGPSTGAQTPIRAHAPVESTTPKDTPPAHLRAFWTARTATPGGDPRLRNAAAQNTGKVPMVFDKGRANASPNSWNKQNVPVCPPKDDSEEDEVKPQEAITTGRFKRPVAALETESTGRSSEASMSDAPWGPRNLAAQNPSGPNPPGRFPGFGFGGAPSHPENPPPRIPARFAPVYNGRAFGDSVLQPRPTTNPGPFAANTPVGQGTFGQPASTNPWNANNIPAPGPNPFQPGTGMGSGPTGQRRYLQPRGRNNRRR